MITLIVKEGWNGQEYNVEIKPRKSIRMYGEYKNHVGGPVHFDKTFRIGDEAEYHSYNLSYTGPITNIGPKTVTIQHYRNNSKTSRLDLEHFCWRNWDFDSAKIAAANFDTMQYI